MGTLAGEALEDAMRDLRGWKVVEQALTRTFQFSTFPDGIAFVNRVADLAEELDHHPDISIRYTSITLSLSTHSEGGITMRDVRLARQIDEMTAR